MSPPASWFRYGLLYSHTSRPVVDTASSATLLPPHTCMHCKRDGGRSPDAGGTLDLVNMDNTFATVTV